jgi:hypothetical protein
MEVEEGGGPDSTLLLANARAPSAFQGGLLEVTGRHGHNSPNNRKQTVNMAEKRKAKKKRDVRIFNMFS